MSNSAEGKTLSSKGNIVFQGKTTIEGDYVERKEVHGNEVHGNLIIGGDNISISGDGNIVGGANKAQVTKTKLSDTGLEIYFERFAEQLDSMKQLSSEERSLVITTLRALQDEIKNGDNVRADKVVSWLEILKETVPELAGSLLEVLVHPLVGKIVESISKSVLRD